MGECGFLLVKPPIPLKNRFHHQTNRAARMDVEHALLDQGGIHSGVEPAVVHHVVHMAIDIVVHPARADGAKRLVAAAGVGLGFGGG